jgi:ATP-dependent Lon protease
MLKITALSPKVRAAFDAGVKEVLLPEENLDEARHLPSYVLEAVKLIIDFTKPASLAFWLLIHPNILVLS